MQLFHSPISPFVRKVMVVLHETDQLGDVELKSVSTTVLASDPTLIAANPLAKLPTLLRPDGPALYDSRVICRFLDDRGKGGLYPAARLWDTLTLEATGDAIMEAGLAIVYEKRLRPAEIQFQPLMDAHWGKADRAIEVLNARWMSHLHGPLDCGQIAVACALGYLDFRMPERDWRTGRDALAAWYSEFCKRPAMQATAPVG
ncbi:glutathione S-transferase [Thetidibacter halocola]|uniref:Glutathione S-transferase n=1 Tax=Thetidibacter halocola TaxID=2827239 RepID=A0A8J7WG59_9RHOB|nr:glutathione S-transferase [Thetidibacter halocola]MBS0124721.1 glutathione S-transferase [Thetidibacter halocola]